MFWFYYFGTDRPKSRYNLKLLINRPLLVICYLCCRTMRYSGLSLNKIYIYVPSGPRRTYEDDCVDVDKSPGSWNLKVAW